MLNRDDVIYLGALIIKLGLDYVRWTQLTPVLLVWGFMLIMLAGLGFVGVYEMARSNPDTIDALIERVEPLAERFIDPVTAPETESEEESVSIQLTEDDIIPWILRAWGILALVGLLMSSIRTWVWGAPERWPLRRKFGVAGIASLIAGWAFLGGAALLDPSLRMIHLVVYGALVPLVLFALCAWALGVGYVVDRVKQFIDTLVSKRTSTSAIWTQDAS
ncbi:MAG: hypothetical protein PPP56_09325 [Longimonas sp.]|uniref:hypothetical protein n=1 Tax=Longimonas sp. TaxID=2039626 RepID=UPI003355BF09